MNSEKPLRRLEAMYLGGAPDGHAAGLRVGVWYIVQWLDVGMTSSLLALWDVKGKWNTVHFTLEVREVSYAQQPEPESESELHRSYPRAARKAASQIVAYYQTHRGAGSTWAQEYGWKAAPAGHGPIIVGPDWCDNKGHRGEYARFLSLAAVVEGALGTASGPLVVEHSVMADLLRELLLQIDMLERFDAKRSVPVERLVLADLVGKLEKQKAAHGLVDSAIETARKTLKGKP